MTTAMAIAMMQMEAAAAMMAVTAANAAVIQNAAVLTEAAAVAAAMASMMASAISAAILLISAEVAKTMALANAIYVNSLAGRAQHSQGQRRLPALRARGVLMAPIASTHWQWRRPGAGRRAQQPEWQLQHFPEAFEQVGISPSGSILWFVMRFSQFARWHLVVGGSSRFIFDFDEDLVAQFRWGVLHINMVLLENRVFLAAHVVSA